MRAIGLDGFEAKFSNDADPWGTWSDRDEAVKRAAILHGLPPGRTGRMLELGAGNGSNSRSFAARALRLDATEATSAGTRLVAEAVAAAGPRARALQLVAPAPPPRDRYDAIVAAELLYYLDPRTMRALARQVAGRLRPGGVLVLAHHRITFYDFAQVAAGIHDRFLSDTGVGWTVRPVRQTRRWAVIACYRRPTARIADSPAR